MTTRRAGSGAGFLLMFGAVSLATVALGCAVAGANGAPASVWARNLIAWAVGGLAAGALARWAGSRFLGGFVLAALAGLVASLLGTGQQGVHRWIDLGPVHMNAAEVLLPPAVVAWGATRWSWLAAVPAIGLLVLQPDASQASALAAALIATLALTPGQGVLRGGGVLLAVAAMITAWLRHDPLAPVPDVEGIMGLAWRLSPIVGVLAWIALGGAALAPLLVSGAAARPVQAPAVALTVYATVSVLTPLVGAFPVPLIGMGMSPIVGLWLGAGLLSAWRARLDEPASP